MKPASRVIAVLMVAAGLSVLLFNSWHYELAAQPSAIISTVPLLFAGLLLRRSGIWLTFIGLLCALALSAWRSAYGGMGGMEPRSEVLADLLQIALAALIVTLILDRLLVQIGIAEQRNRDLRALYERLQVEVRERDQAQQQLVHSQRVDALGKLAGNMAHDFNNILSVVLGYARRAQRLAREDKDGAPCLEGIVAATQRGSALTSRLLTLTRREAQLAERFDVTEAVRSLAPALESLFGEDIRFELELPPRPAPVVMNRHGLEATLLNIAKNASDALGAAGRFRIVVSADEREVEIRLEDTGCGMTRALAARVFEPFFTTKPRDQGAGIGLAVAYRVVTEAHGLIEVESEPGSGTRFVIRLPCAPESAGNPSRN